MSACLACLSAEIKSGNVLCTDCYKGYRAIRLDVEEDDVDAEELRRKLWGQKFEKNRTPENRARIAWAAYQLAEEGDDEILTEIRRTFPAQRIRLAPDSVVERRSAPAVREPSSPNGRASHPVDLPGKFVTEDGHRVRSKSERAIADYLFRNGFRYQYEVPVTIAGVHLRPDFFLPDVGPHGTYIEHFGMDTESYLAQAQRKIQLFAQAGLNLITTTEADVNDIYGALHRKLETAKGRPPRR